MTKKYKSEPTLEEAKKRLKEFGRKHREQYPVPPVNSAKPEGLLAGNPDKIIDQIKKGFEDDYGKKKPGLKMDKNTGM